MDDPSLSIDIASLRQHCGALRQRCRDEPERPLKDLSGDLDALLAVLEGPAGGASSAVASRTASATRRAAILEAAPDALLAVDMQGHLHDINTAAETLFGLRRAEALGRPVWELDLPRGVIDQVVSHLPRQAEHGPLQVDDASPAAATASGSPLTTALVPVVAAEPPLLALFAREVPDPATPDVGEDGYRRRLRALSAQLLLVEETERRRLANELHDGLCQSIALARLKYAALRPTSGGTLGKALDEIAALIEHADGAARAITFELSPPILHELGLAPAVQWLVENFQERYGIPTVLEIGDAPLPADEDTRVILYRAIRELLINAARHARAETVRVRLVCQERHVTAAVEDDGIGMDPDTIHDQGYGLFSINERIRHIGGSMQIDSAPGRGTTVRLSAIMAGEPPAAGDLDT